MWMFEGSFLKTCETKPKTKEASKPVLKSQREVAKNIDGVEKIWQETIYGQLQY